MNISSINAYNNVAFSAQYKKGKYAKQATRPRAGAHASNNYSKNSVKQIKKAGIIAGIAAVAVATALLMPKNDTKSNSAVAETTQPTETYTQTQTTDEATTPT